MLGGKSGRWPVALAPPLCLSLSACGVAVGYGQASVGAIVSLVLLAICLRGVGLAARALGSIIDSQRERTEYLERKFGRFAASSRGIDPMTSTAGDSRTTFLTGAAGAFTALSVALGWTFLVSANGLASAGVWYGMAAVIALAALEMLAYLGTWRYRCHPYGLIVTFLAQALGCLGATYSMIGELFVPTVFSAIGPAAIACSIEALGELSSMAEDSKGGKRTLALAAGARIGRAACPVLAVLGIVWIAAYPIVCGMQPWRLSFLLLCIPMAVTLVSVMRAGPSDVAGLETSLSASCILACLAFACCVAGTQILAISI